MRVMVRSVTMAMERIEKSAACTESWPIKPLATQAGPLYRACVRRYIEPDIVLLRVFMNSGHNIST